MTEFIHDYNSTKQFINAARRGSETVLHKFLSPSTTIDVNVCDDRGIPALFHILRAGSGRNTNPLMTKMLAKSPDTQVYFQKDGATTNFLIEACLYKNFELLVKILENRDFDVNFENENGFSAVKACLRSGSEAGLNLLFNKSAQPVAVSKDLLFQAIEGKQWGIFARMITDSSVDLSFQNEKGTILHEMAQKGFYLNFVQAFPRLKAALDFNVLDSQGKSALDYAIAHKSYRMIYHLMKNGASHMKPGMTPNDTKDKEQNILDMFRSVGYEEKPWVEETKAVMEIYRNKFTLEQTIKAQPPTLEKLVAKNSFKL